MTFRLVLFRRFEQSPAVFHGPDDLAVLFEQFTKSVQDQRVVVGEQHARLAHGAPPMCGTRTHTCVPLPVVDAMSSDPFTNETRSFMLSSPNPFRTS